MEEFPEDILIKICILLKYDESILGLLYKTNKMLKNIILKETHYSLFKSEYFIPINCKSLIKILYTNVYLNIISLNKINNQYNLKIKQNEKKINNIIKLIDIFHITLLFKKMQELYRHKTKIKKKIYINKLVTKKLYDICVQVDYNNVYIIDLFDIKNIKIWMSS
jgi:hypothetical protein